MAISKRKIPKKKTPIKLHPKVRAHNKKCDLLYTRLQQNELEAICEVKELVGCDDVMHGVLSKVSGNVSTLQHNNPVTYRTCLTWEDRSVDPKFGYLYPRKVVVKTATSMVISATLSYVELCKQIGRFI